MRLIIDGYDLTDTSDGITVNKLSGFEGLPTVRMATGSNAGRDGGWSSDGKFDPRVLSVTGAIWAEDTRTFEIKRISFMTKLANATRNEVVLRWQTDGGHTYQTNVRVTKVETTSQKSPHQQTFNATMRADDPIWYDTTETSGIIANVSLAAETGGFEIPFQIPLQIGGGATYTNVLNTGTSTVYPLVTIRGNVNTPTITNLDTNESVTLYTSNTEPDTIEINNTPTLHTITRNGTDNLYQTLAEGSKFLTLPPGTSRIQFRSENKADVAVAEIKYLSGYIGV